MTITKIPSPQDNVPSPLQCVTFRIFPDEYIITPCTPPSYTLEVGAGTAADGVTFTIDGYTFVTDSAQPYTAYSVDLTGTQAEQVANLKGMLSSNPLFLGQATIQNTATEVLIEYYECRNDLIVDLTNVPHLTWTPDGGNSFLETLPGFKIAYQVFGDTPNKPLTDVITVPPNYVDDVLQDTVVDLTEFFCSYFAYAPTLPSSPYNVAFYDNDNVSQLYLKYGYAYLAPNGCDNIFSIFEESGFSTVINAKPDRETSNVIFKYVFDSFSTPIKFLTYSPSVKAMCVDQYEWLRFYGTVENSPTGPISNYFAEFSFYDLDGNLIGDLQTDVGAVDGVIVVPVGWANLPVAQPGNVSRYTVKIKYGTSTLTETKTFALNDCCEGEEEELYFLNALSNYDTIRFERKDSMSVSTEGEEICLHVPCSGTKHEKLTEDYRNNNWEATEEITLRVETDCNEDNLEFLKSFKASNSIYIRRTSKFGEVVFRSFRVPPGSSRIFNYRGNLVMTVTGQIDIPVLC